MTRHVLLLNSDKDTVLRRLGARTDIRLSVIAAKRYSALYEGRYRVEYVSSLRDLTGVLGAALTLAASASVDHVVTPTEKSIIPGAMVRSYLGVAGVGFDQAMWFTHKHAMKRRLREHGIAVADFGLAGSAAQVAEVADRLGWPVVVKPVLGAGMRDTFRADTAADLAADSAGRLAALVEGGLPIQVEKAVRMRHEYHCDSVVRGGRCVFTSVARYFQPVLSGPYGCGAALLDTGDPIADRIGDLNARAIGALELRDGVTHMECFETDQGLVLGEITVRPGGAGIPRVVARAHGVDLWEEFVRAALAEPAGRPRPASPGAHAWTRVLTDDAGAARITRLPGVFDVRLEQTLSGAVDRHIACLSATDAASLRRIRADVDRTARR